MKADEDASLAIVVEVARNVADYASDHVPGSPEGASPGLRAEVRRLRAALATYDACRSVEPEHVAERQRHLATLAEEHRREHNDPTCQMCTITIHVDGIAGPLTEYAESVLEPLVHEARLALAKGSNTP